MAQRAYFNANCGEVEGMVAVVHGLPDATLAVNLFDNGKVYSLLPNPRLEKTDNRYHNQTSNVNCQNSDLNCTQHPGVNCCSSPGFTQAAGLNRRGFIQATGLNRPGTASKSSETDPVPLNTVCVCHRNNGAQVSDGRYASTYQVNHCRATPTSPQQFLPEFPPQRLEPDRVTFVKSTYPACNSWNGNLKNGTNFITDTYGHGMVTSKPERHLRHPSLQKSNEKGKSKRELSSSLLSLENYTRNLSKNIQTYTRNSYENQEQTEDTDREIYGVEREIRSDILCKDSQLNTPLDYMRCIGKKRPTWMEEGIFSRDMDVRHLADVTKCIRERIRFFCAEDVQPTESNVCERGGCPRLVERFMRHQRQCSGLIHPKIDAVDMEIQAAARKSEKEVSTSCDREPTKLCVSNPNVLALADIISIPRFCQCKVLKSQVFPCPKCRTANMLNAKIRREIQNWHAKIPVSAHESQKDRCKRHKMLDSLADRVIEIADILEGDDLKIYMEKEVKKSVKGLPMWTPGSKCCDDSLKDKMSNSLAERLYEIINEKPNILEETISNWLEDVALSKSVNQTFDKKKLLKELKERIKAISKRRPSCDAYFRNALTQEINDTLEQWFPNFENVCNKNRLLITMSEQLADLVKDLASANGNDERDEVANKIQDWIKNYPQLFKQEIDRNAIDLLSNTLIRVLHEDDPRPDEIQDEITQWLSLHTTKLPDEQIISKFTDTIIPMATSTPRESADTTTYTSLNTDSGTLIDNVRNILNKSGLPIRPEVRARLALDIVDVLAASPEEVCARNEDSLNIIQSLLQEESYGSEEQANRVAQQIMVLAEVHGEVKQLTHDNSSSSPSSEKKLCYTVIGKSKRSSHCDQSYREQLEESIHEVLEEQDIHPNNENETIGNLVAAMESINIDCDESCFERSFQRKVLPEVSKLLSQCTQCSPNKVKLSTTVEELKSRFNEIKNRTARELFTEAKPNKSDTQNSEHESNIIKIKITQWAEELPLRLEPKGEVKKVKDNMITELSEEIGRLQRQQETEKAQPNRYHQKVREKVMPWLKKLPLQSGEQTNTEEMADELVKRVVMSSEYFETAGGPDQTQLENTIMNWFKNSSFYRQITAEDRRRQILLVPQLAIRLREIQAGFLNTSLDDSALSKRIRDVIVEFLRNLPIVNGSCRNEEAFQASANELLNQMIYGDKSGLNHTVMDENEVFENIVSEWITNLPLPERLGFEEIQNHNDLKDKFIKQISYMRENPDRFSENAMRGEIIRLMSIFPIADNKKRDRRFLYSQATDLIEKLRAVPYNPEPETNFNKYLALLKREVAIWIDEFPVGYADVEGEEVRRNKAASQLAEKIFMVQIRHPNESDQEAYEEELYEIISRWLTALNQPKIDTNKHRLAVRLIIRINDLESRMANAVMQIVPLKPYKERYLENIAAGAVPLRFINKEEEKMHQEIIHNMANAFINRNYKLEDPEQRSILLEALCAHIRDFLDYVETLPDEQPNYEALRAELEEVLKQVPVPDLEKLRKEQLIKHTWKIVTAWYKSLPVNPAVDPEEEMDRVRMLNYLNIKMAKIGKYSNVDYEEGNSEDRMVKEIFNFLKTLPLHPNDCATLNKFTDNLLTAYLEAERSLPRSPLSKTTETGPFTEQLPNKCFEIGPPCGKEKEGKRSKRTIPEKELHEKHIIEQPSDPSLLNRTADQVHFQRPKESVNMKPLASAPPECPVECRSRTLTSHQTIEGKYDSYYDPAYVDERFLDESLENYPSFKQKAQFSSSIIPAQDQSSKRVESCRDCFKSGRQTSKTTQSPQASIPVSKAPQSPKASQYHKSCVHPTEEKNQTICGSPKSGRRSPKSLDQSLRRRAPSPKTDSSRSGVTGINLKIESQDEQQCKNIECPMMSTEEPIHELPAHHTSQVSDTDRYRYGQTRFREHYDGPQSVPARPADFAISATLQREIDLARQIGMYDEPVPGRTGQRTSTGSSRVPGSAQGKRQGPCVSMGIQDRQQRPPGTDDEMLINCPCVQKMLNCRSFGFFFRPSCPSIPTGDAMHQCPHCCNLCPCPNFEHFKPPCS